MGQGFQQFEFKTKNIPQVESEDGNWENIPLASFPPVFDISIPTSTANAVSQAMTNLTNTFQGLNNSYQALTQQIQDASCSLGDLAETLKNAQITSENFANQNNQTTAYIRTIGLEPVGTITSAQTFLDQVRSIMNDTGNSTGQIPRLLPAEIPLNPVFIANSLASGGSTSGTNLGEATQINQLAGATLGLNLPILSNDQSFRDGFAPGNVTFDILEIIKDDTTQRQVGSQTFIDQKAIVTLSISNSDGIRSATEININNATNSINNGTFKIESFSVVSGSSNPSFFGKAANTILGRQLIRVKYVAGSYLAENELAPEFVVTETATSASATFQQGVTLISAAAMIQSALEQSGLIGQGQKDTIAVSDLLDILIDYNIIGTNPDKVEQDRQAALERLTRLLSPSAERIGGIVMVGKAPNLASLVKKTQALAEIMEWLGPLADRLATSALADITAPTSGIDFDPTGVQLNKLDPKSNIAFKDVESVKEQISTAGVLDFEQQEIQSIPNDQNPAPTEFNAWRKYKPAQLLSGLETFGAVDNAENFVQGSTAAAINGLTGTLSDLISQGQEQLNQGINHLDGQCQVLEKLANDMNGINDRLVDGLNWLKNKFSSGPISLDGHLIGPQLDLLSNVDFVNAVDDAINNLSDPNRPTFGPSPTPGVFQTQQELQQAIQGGVESSDNNAIWFGVVIVVIDRPETIGNQLSTIAELLNMDSSKIRGVSQSRLELNL